MDKTDAVGKTDTMGIGHNGRLSKYVAHDQVGTFAPHAGKFQKCVEVFRNFVLVLFVEDPHAGADIPSLAFSKTAGTYNGLDIFRFCSCQGCHVRIFCVEILNHHIHSGIGALSCQADTYKKFPGIIIIQGTVCVRIFFFKRLMTS